MPKPPPLISLIGSDGTGKSFLLQRLRQLSLPVRAAFLPCTDYHSSPYCAHPALSLALERLSRHADNAANPMLKAYSLLLKMTLYADELANLTERLQPAVVFATRHPVIDTAVYLGVFLEELGLKGKLEKFDQNHLFSMLTPVERAEVDAWTGQLARRHGPANLAMILAGLQTKTLPEQLEALRLFYTLPLPEHCLFLDPAPESLNRQLQSKGNEAELHERLALLQLLQDRYRLVLGQLPPEVGVTTWQKLPSEEGMNETIRALVQHIAM